MFCQEPCHFFMQNESKWGLCVLSSFHVALMRRASLPNYGRRFTNCFQKQMGKKKRLRLKCKWNRKLSSAKQWECSSDASESGLLSFTYTAQGIQSCFGAETGRKHPAFRLPGSLKSWWKGDKHNQIQFFKTNIKKYVCFIWFIKIYLLTALEHLVVLILLALHKPDKLAIFYFF